MKRFAGLVVAAVLMAAPVAVQAQAGRPAPSVSASSSAGAAAVSPEMLSKTVHETWVDSGRNEDKFFDVVQSMAAMSAQKRGVTLPNTEAAGQKMGNLIKSSARRDPDQLLYAVVDAAVRQTAGVSSARSQPRQ
ncbi:hypothetical protein [Terriglobus sp.]|uniref:hypothetical protein n=1 Tax=Terriglobus sp. TaxID=1889013 RepID=UPI003B0005DA